MGQFEQNNNQRTSHGVTDILHFHTFVRSNKSPDLPLPSAITRESCSNSVTGPYYCSRTIAGLVRLVINFPTVRHSTTLIVDVVLPWADWFTDILRSSCCDNTGWFTLAIFGPVNIHPDFTAVANQRRRTSNQNHNQNTWNFHSSRN